MFPQGEKRSTFMYNTIPMQISGPGQYQEHPDYEYLEGRKLEDVYPSGQHSSVGSPMMFRPLTLRVMEAKSHGEPAFKSEARERSIGK